MNAEMINLHPSRTLLIPTHTLDHCGFTLVFSCQSARSLKPICFFFLRSGRDLHIFSLALDELNNINNSTKINYQQHLWDITLRPQNEQQQSARLITLYSKRSYNTFVGKHTHGDTQHGCCYNYCLPHHSLKS